MLVDTGDTIAEHFPDYDNSPFVQEKFFEDWSTTSTGAGSRTAASSGHNLKIAWNLMRIHSLEPKRRVRRASPRRSPALMPKIGGDQQRGGWYDVVEREAPARARSIHRFAWHDRKAWWQQEQGILAYLILAGSLDEPEYLKLARESAAFYNALFLDHDIGRASTSTSWPTACRTCWAPSGYKGSHSMSGYHSFELCYLAAVYTNLLVTKQPMDLHFKPKPGAFEGQHPARLAGHAAEGQHQDRGGHGSTASAAPTSTPRR